MKTAEIKLSAAAMLILFGILSLTGCGGGDPEDDDRARIDPPICANGACR